MLEVDIMTQHGGSLVGSLFSTLHLLCRLALEFIVFVTALPVGILAARPDRLTCLILNPHGFPGCSLCSPYWDPI